MSRSSSSCQLVTSVTALTCRFGLVARGGDGGGSEDSGLCRGEPVPFSESGVTVRLGCGDKLGAVLIGRGGKGCEGGINGGIITSESGRLTRPGEVTTAEVLRGERASLGLIGGVNCGELPSLRCRACSAGKDGNGFF